ncbi:MAG: hypothetical protein ACKOQ8_02825 [Micrococcales bacterium]
MKKAFWLLTGIAAGLVIAKQLDENPRAQAVVDDAAKRAKEFGAAIAEGFRERESELAAAPVKPVAAKTSSAKTSSAKKPVSARGNAAAKTKTGTKAASKTARRGSAAAKPTGNTTK